VTAARPLRRLLPGPDEQVVALPGHGPQHTQPPDEAGAAVVPFRSRRPGPAPSPAPAGGGQVLPLVAVLLTAVVAQVALAPHLAPGGAPPDLLLLSTTAVAAARGRETGAAYGFAAGLAADLFVATPFGLGALAFTLAGQAGGGAAGGRCPTPRRAAVSGGLVCLGAGLFVASIGGLLAGGGGPVPPFPVTVRLLAGSVVTALLAPAVFAAVRRVPSPPPAESARP
jgi:rod shape-determining protein MreD